MTEADLTLARQERLLADQGHNTNL